MIGVAGKVAQTVAAALNVPFVDAAAFRTMEHEHPGTGRLRR